MSQSYDVTVTVHEAEIELIVMGEWVGPDESVGVMSGGLEDMVLCWQDEQPVEDEVLKIIGDEAVERAFETASVKAGEEGPPEPDPDYRREDLLDRETNR